jgi:hypothetical protein
MRLGHSDAFRSRLQTLGAALIVGLLTMASLLVVGPSPARAAYTSTITNFDSGGNATVRFDTRGNAVDAHDGEISVFNGTYYLYGTAYDCGYQWRGAGAPFCGFKVYSSSDLTHWTDRGYLVQRIHVRMLPAARGVQREHPDVRVVGQRL